MAAAKKQTSVDAFEALVAPHISPLYGFACQRTRKPADAEDLVQDTLLRAWDRIDTLADPERVRPWLFKILVNLYYERARKNTRRNQILPMKDLEDQFDERVVSPHSSPFDEVQRRRAADAVHEALTHVPTPFAMALELRDLEGLSYKEISQVLEIPMGTVMSRIARGRKLMAELLQEWRPATRRAMHTPCPS